MSSQFKFELNLQQMSSIRLAIDLWQQPSMKKKIQQFLTENELCSSNFVQKKINEWDRELLEQIKKKNLPNAVKNDLSTVVKPVGDRMFEYLRRIARKNVTKKMYPSVKNYYEKIKWTTIGTIDEPGTFKDIFYAIPNDEIIDMAHLFIEACRLCLKKCIKIIWTKCTNEEKRITVAKIEQEEINDSSTIYLYWKRHVYGKKSNAYKQSAAISNSDVFKSCIKDYNVDGVKYFFNELTQIEKTKILVPIAEKLLNEYVSLSKASLEYIYHNMNEKIDILIFLMENMSEKTKQTFICEHKIRILEILINEWPWRYLFLDTLEFSLNHLTKKEYNEIMMNLLQLVVDDYDCLKMSQPTSLWIIVEAWKKCPEFLKESIIKICWSSPKSMTFKLQAIALITSAIDDNGIEPMREAVCKNFIKSSNKLLMTGHHQVVDIYVQNILKIDDEKKLFIEKIKTKNICRHLIMKQQYGELDKFLNWRFKNESEKNKFKHEMKNDVFCITIICRIWKKCKDIFIEKIKPIFDKFFKWFNFTETELSALKEKMKNNSQVKFYLKRYYIKCPHLFVALLSACTFSTDEIEEMQAKIISQSKK